MEPVVADVDKWDRVGAVGSRGGQMRSDGVGWGQMGKSGVEMDPNKVD